MTIEQFERAVNTVGYAVIASPLVREHDERAIVPPMDDGTICDHVFVYDREATYDEMCAYTSAAFGMDTKSLSEEEWRKKWKALDTGWTPYIIRTD